MRNYLLAAVAATALATPALARDGSPYVGVDAGIMLVEDANFDLRTAQTTVDNAFTVGFKPGFDVDVLAGYDFGMFRLEGELGFKRASIDDITVNSTLLGADDFDSDGRVRVLSIMANGLLDFGDDDGWSGYVGPGIGRASVKFPGDRDSALAYQVVAGVRKAITPNIDLGLKYRYFRTFTLRYDDGAEQVSTKLRTHSLLASLVYNFAAPEPVIVEPVIAPPPPPPEPAPATQTCYDGSVILATDVCPQPPMPAPAPERG